jgi:phage gp16-like protein
MDERRKLLALIHILKNQLNLEDSKYRQILQEVVGADSCKTLENKDLIKVAKHLRALKGKKLISQLDRIVKGGKLTQLDLIYGLWNQLYRAGKLQDESIQGLTAYIKRVVGVERPEWLTVAQKQKLIEMLKRWLKR